MPLPSNGDLRSDDPSSGGRSNPHHQRRKLEKGESSRTGELSAQVEKRSYNLRQRRDDPLAMLRRLKFVGQRRRQKEIRVARQKRLNEVADILCDSIQNFLCEIPSPVSKDDMKNRTEISCVDQGALAEDWRPYFSKPDIGVSNTLKAVNWTVEKLALNAAPSVVALQSSTGTTKLFACSGTVVEFFEGSGLIVTIANLVKCPGRDEVVDNLKIDVYLQNHELLQGELLYFDFYHNICVIKIERTVHLPIQTFSSKIKAVNFTKNYSRDVVTLGRARETHVLLVSTGKIIPKCSKVHCEELLVSSCKISKGEVGGPLIDFTGNTIGMNYYHTKETPFIPGFIVSKCLEQFKIWGQVVRPWHGLRVRTLYAEECSVFEKLRTNLRGVNGVIVEKIEKQSSVSDLNEGDVINKVNGVYFSTTAELAGILLDIGKKCLLDGQNNNPSAALCLKFGVRGREREGTVVVKSPPSHLNRWSFPKPIIVRQYCEGKVVDEKWYTTQY